MAQLVGELGGAGLEGRQLEPTQGVEEFVARHAGDLGRLGLREQAELIPLHCGGQPHLPDKVFRRRPQGGDSILRQLQRHPHAHEPPQVKKWCREAGPQGISAVRPELLVPFTG
jgi:hypothetical protein